MICPRFIQPEMYFPGILNDTSNHNASSLQPTSPNIVQLQLTSHLTSLLEVLKITNLVSKQPARPYQPTTSPPQIPTTSPAQLTCAFDCSRLLLRVRHMAAPTSRQQTRLIQRLRVVIRVRRKLGYLGVCLRALRDGNHGVLGPDVDGLGPVQALDAAALDGHDVFRL